LSIRRAAARLAVLISCVAALGGLALPADAASKPVVPQEVLVISVPGLTWSDVPAIPALRGLMARGAVGSLTAKAEGTSTRCLSGSLTFSAGNRAVTTGPGCDVPPGDWASLRSANLNSSYGARIGALGSALRAAGVGTQGLSPVADPMLTGVDGTIGPPTGSTGRIVVATLEPSLGDDPNLPRLAADRTVEQLLRVTLSALPVDTTTVIVTATADATTGGPSLHPLVIAGPGWPHRALTFPGARAPYAEGIDLAPTILHILGIPVPPTMAGKPLQVTGSAVRSVSAYADDDRHAQAGQSVQAPFLLALGWMTILVVLLAALGRPAVRWPARLLAPAPVLSFVVNLLPWWRWDRAVYAGVLAIGCVIVAGLTTLLARRRAVLAMLAVPAGSLAVLVVDQLAGAPTQRSSPLGYDPLDAGRFVGVGNLDFAVIAIAAVLLASVAGSRLPRRTGLPIAAAVMVVALVVDIAPSLGDDAGGVLALVPAAAVVVAALAGVRLSATRVAAVLAATGVVAVGIALADYSRPASSQTHIGQFVGQLLHGGAGTEVGRKAHAALATAGLTVSTAVVVACLVAAVVRRRQLRLAADADAGLLALLAGTVTAAVLGSVLNDSGLNIAAVAAAVAASAMFSAQWPTRAPTRSEASINATAVTTTTRTAATDSPDSPGR
jgi:hypothetical protein